jgi:hypothetical protein
VRKLMDNLVNMNERTACLYIFGCGLDEICHFVNNIGKGDIYF